MKRAKYVLLVFILVIVGIGIKTLIQEKRSNTIESIHKNTQESEPVKQEKVNKPISNYNVSQLSLSEWNTPYGIPYVQVPGANLGVTSFELLDKNKVSYLCDATSEIIITDMSSGKAIKKFRVLLTPRDFIYENGFFFVLGERQVIVYDANGEEKKQYNIPTDYNGRAGRLTRFDNATYLLLVSGNCVKIESGGETIIPQENEGWITSTGSYITTQVNGDNSYSISIIQTNGKILKKVFVADKKVAGVFVVGTTSNLVVLDVQTFISENPISVERIITSISLQKDNLGAIIGSIKVPDSYYVLSNKEFDVSITGDIINMVTSPQGVQLFSLTQTTSNVNKGYPEYLTNTKYHFNDHLLKIDK